MLQKAARIVIRCISEAKKVDPNLRAYLCSGCAKISLKVNSEDQIDRLASHASEIGLLSILDQDKAVLGIGPAKAEEIDKVTRKLKLF